MNYFLDILYRLGMCYVRRRIVQSSKRTFLNVNVFLVYIEFLSTMHRVKPVVVFVYYFALYCMITR